MQIAAARRAFERQESAQLSVEMTRNRLHTRAMLASRNMNREARAAALRPSGRAPLADASPPELLARLKAMRQAQRVELVAESIVARTAEPEEEDERGKILGTETFQELWPKLVRCGWKYQKGKGLETWIYQRPGAGEASGQPKGKKKGKKPPKGSANIAPHVFSAPAPLMQFVAAAKLDGVEFTGHVHEVYPDDSGELEKASDDDKKRAAAPTSLKQPTQRGITSAALAVATTARNLARGGAGSSSAASLKRETAQVPVDPEPPSMSAGSARSEAGECGVTVDTCAGWGSGALFGFGVPTPDQVIARVTVLPLTVCPQRLMALFCLP